MNKAVALRIHAKRQAFLRYGVTLNSADLRELIEAIRKGDGVFIQKKSNRVSCWKVYWRGTPLVLLYDKVRKSVVTFLPSDCWEVQKTPARTPSTAH